MKGLDDPTPNLESWLKTQHQTISYPRSFAAILNIELGFADLKILTSTQEDDIYVSRDNDRHNFGDIHGSGPFKESLT